MAPVAAATLLTLSRLTLAQAAPHPPQPPPPGVSTPGVTRSTDTLKKLAVFPVAGTPDWSVVTEDSVWVDSARANHVVQLNARTNQPGLIADVKRPCSGLAWGFGSVWVPSCGDHTLIRLDPATAKPAATIAADPANSEGGITVGVGAVWLITKPSRLVRIDPATNTIKATLDLPAGAANLAFGGNALWITSFEDAHLLRVDPAKMTVTATIPVGPKPRFLTIGDGSVWTLNQGDGTVSRVDMQSLTVRATIACGIPGEGGEIAFGEGFVWATLFGVPLTQIDPGTNTVVRQWKGPGGDGLRVGLGSLWLSNLAQGTVWRLSPTQD